MFSLCRAVGIMYRRFHVSGWQTNSSLKDWPSFLAGELFSEEMQKTHLIVRRRVQQRASKQIQQTGPKSGQTEEMQSDEESLEEGEDKDAEDLPEHGSAAVSPPSLCSRCRICRLLPIPCSLQSLRLRPVQSLFHPLHPIDVH